MKRLLKQCICLAVATVLVLTSAAPQNVNAAPQNVNATPNTDIVGAYNYSYKNSPLDKNGKLTLKGTDIVNKKGKKIQLKGSCIC